MYIWTWRCITNSTKHTNQTKETVKERKKLRCFLKMEIVRFAVAVIFALSSISSSNAATTPPSGGAGDAHSMPCIQKLMPCQPYLHSSTPLPPASCCMPLKEIVETDVTCLCSVFNNVDMLRSLNLTKENALVLPKACGANADVSQCKASTGE